MKWNAFLVFLTLQANRELVKAHITFCFIREWTLLAAKQHAKDPAQTLLPELGDQDGPRYIKKLIKPAAFT